MSFENYSKAVTKEYEQYAETFFKKANLEPGFDIIKLLNKYGIEVITVKSLPYNWEYAFNNDVNNFKIFYLKSLLPEIKQNADTNDKIKYLKALEFAKKDLRFVLAEALADIISNYQLDNNLDKVLYGANIYCREKIIKLILKKFELKFVTMCFLMLKEN